MLQSCSTGVQSTCSPLARMDWTGHCEQYFHIDDVVDIIVNMRKSRDGLVETPRQLRFILDLLNLDNHN